MDTASEAQATIGARIGQLNDLQALTADKSVTLAGALADVEDTDLGKAIMELTLQQTVAALPRHRECVTTLARFLR